MISLTLPLDEVQIVVNPISFQSVGGIVAGTLSLSSVCLWQRPNDLDGTYLTPITYVNQNRNLYCLLRKSPQEIVKVERRRYSR